MNTIAQIRKGCDGEWLALWQEDTIITELAIDSRAVEYPGQTLFVALTSPLRDGHDFIQDAWEKGVRNFLVSRHMDTSRFPECNILFTTDTLVALQHIAATHRKSFDIPVIGITGSNGKTVVKEWLAQLLEGSFHLVRSPKSYNSQIGVPLSVWLMKKEHDLAIFEAGISQPGEMEKLEPIIQPSIGIFTTIGAAHSEGFQDLTQKIDEKLLLFRHTQRLIYCIDNEPVHERLTHFVQLHATSQPGKPTELFTWSFRRDATLSVSKVTATGGKTSILARYRQEEIGITIPFTDDASIENAIHCWCTLLLLGVANDKIQAGMALLQQVSMRLEMRHGINDCTVINDAYNSDLTSLQLALNYLGQQRQHERHTVIMSDIMQPGKRDSELYEEVATYITRRNIQRFIGVGPALYRNKDLFKKHKQLKTYFYKSTEHLLKNFHLLSFEKEAILLKGARIFEFEKIGLLLEQKVHQTIMSVDLSALKHNLDVFRSILKPGVKTMAMVKAFAYGSGSYEIANLLQYAGVDYLAVAYTDEGVALRKAGIKVPIMVMSPDMSSFDRMIAWKLEPEIYNFRSLNAFTAIAKTLQVSGYKVHIKLDTGMHRLGFNTGDMAALSTQVAATPEIAIASIFSHLAASDDSDEDTFTATQAAHFESMSGMLMGSLTQKPLRHLCNSAGISRHSKLQYDMVRLGLGLYGVDGSSKLQSKLKQISTLRTSIAQIRDLPAGENIGYGHHTISARDMRIATVCIGYADGYPRALGNGRAYMLVNGKQAPTIGNICMDMCMVDITDIAEVAEGDDAVVFGPGLAVTELAKRAGTISYEIMTGISQRVKRVYMNEE